MSTNDYVKFVTQQFVAYMDRPKSDRQQKREQRKREREPFLVRWFGILPLCITLYYNKIRQSKQEDG
jgi:hypothetical protein